MSPSSTNPSSAAERTLSPTLRAFSVRLSREVRAAPARIFDAWLHADALRTFLFADQSGGAIRSEIDARVGGVFRIVRQHDGEQVEYSGEYLEVDRPHRLAFTLFIEKYAQRDDRVIVEFAPIGQRSLVVLIHEFSLRDPAERSRIQRGWARALDRLVASCVEGEITHAVAPRGGGAAHPGTRAIARALMT
jgi:uncharacterized protein YndB with AHSA1/START domain